MNIFHTYGSAAVLVVIALVIILPLLAYLQFTWLGQISTQEYERMKENLQAIATHCSMDFSREITELMKSLDGRTSGSDADIQHGIHERILRWKAQSSFPAIISSQTSFGPLPSPDQAVRIMATEESHLFLLKDFSAIALTVHDRTAMAIFIPLNREYLSSVVLPKLIQTDFPASTRSEYDIIILNENGIELYSSTEPASNEILQTADLRIPFLILPPAMSVSMPPGGPERSRLNPERGPRPEPLEGNPGSGEQRNGIPPPQINAEPRWEHGPGERTMGVREPSFHRLRGEEFKEQSLFEMRLRNREGSLEAAVKNNRLRNFAMSSGILLLLGASMLFLLLSTHRARRLALQQLQFVAGVSHELRTPLAVLKSAGENLADGVIQEKDRTRKYGELIKNEVIRLSDMIEKALAYAGIQSGKQHYELQPLDIAPLITEALQNAKKSLPSSSVHAELQIDDGLPQVLGDATALRSALENIIINGIKYGAGKEWIRIEATRVNDSRTSTVKMNVEDHGIGIAATDITHIFQPFYRGRNAVDGQIQGSGLGLSITKYIIESHGGTITAKSSPHNGTVFTILLPGQSQEAENS